MIEMMTDIDKKAIAAIFKRLDRAFLKMQLEENNELLKLAAKKAIVLSPEEIDEKIKYCIKFGGRLDGKRAFYTRLAVLAEIQRNQKGGKLWPFTVIPKLTRSGRFITLSSGSALTVRLSEHLEK
jgi:hypothetical protein